MTEEEAKKKWCPHARFKFSALSDCPASNRDDGSDGCKNPFLRSGTRCLGSECMAWRWSTAKETEAFLGLVRDRMKATGENFAKATQAALVENGETFVKTEGFCGLAGAPK